MKKNQAGQLFHIVAFDQDGRVTGQAANITCTLSVDGGSRAATSDVNPTEIGETGEYSFSLTQAEVNGHALSFAPVCSTSGVQVLGMPSNVIYTIETQALAGPHALIVTITDSATGAPIEGATIRMYRAGETGTQATDDSGETTFGLTAATWSWIALASGYNSQTGTLVVSDDGELEIALVAASIEILPAPLCSVTLPTTNQYGLAQSGVSVSIKFIAFNDGAVPTGVIVNSEPAIRSSSLGLVVTPLLRSASYIATYRIGNERPKEIPFDVPNAGSYLVVES